MRPALLRVATPWMLSLSLLTMLAACGGGGGGNSPAGTATGTSVTPPSPSVTLSVQPTTITAGDSAMLTWKSQNATACTGSNGWSGAIDTSGSVSTGALTSTTEYDLVCTGPGGSAQQRVLVTVTAPPPVVQL